MRGFILKIQFHVCQKLPKILYNHVSKCSNMGRGGPGGTRGLGTDTGTGSPVNRPPLSRLKHTDEPLVESSKITCYSSPDRPFPLLYRQTISTPTRIYRIFGRQGEGPWDPFATGHSCVARVVRTKAKTKPLSPTTANVPGSTADVGEDGKSCLNVAAGVAVQVLPRYVGPGDWGLSPHGPTPGRGRGQIGQGCRTAKIGLGAGR